MGKTQRTFVAESAGREPSDFGPGGTSTGNGSLDEIRVRRGEPMIVESDRIVLSGEHGPEASSGRPRFEPLASISALPKTCRPATTVKKFAIPKIVQQVLADCAEHWLHLAKGVEQRCDQSDLRSVLVASSLTGEGCTTIATCLAITLAQHTEKRILLVDADFTHPGLAATLGLKPRQGFEQALIEGLPLDQALIACESPPMLLLPLVHGFEFPSMALQGDKLAEVMESLHAHADIIVIDGGCVFAGRNPMPLTNGVDAALLVRHPDKSSEPLLDQLDAYLSERGVCGLGVIENCVDDL